MTKQFKRFMVLVAILMILAVPAFYNGLTIQRYSMQTDQAGSGTMQIVFISDLHSCIYGKDQKDLTSRIKKQKPDLILLGGDIADDGNPIIGTEQFLNGMKGLAPIYYVSGNHEYWSGEVKNIKDVIRSYGVTILEADYERITVNGIPIVIAGIDDPDKERYTNGYSETESMEKAFRALDQVGGYKILLAHRPERVQNYLKYNFDLILSGHAHGGQVRIPFLLNGLLSPNQGWFPQYAGGLYRHGEVSHIVGRGVSFSPRLPRIFNPPEIVVIKIKGEE